VCLGHRRRRAVAAATVALLSSATLGVTGSAATADPATVTVTVDTRAGLGLVPATGLGANDAVWDGNLGTDSTSGLLRDAGVQVRRYPGGSYSDIYHWKDNTAPGGYVAPDTDFDTFVASTRKSGSQPMVIANYGTGTAQEAADWVRYANKTKKYGVKYWEIGNEIYGNGHYGSAWEADDHADKSPTAYADGVVAYAAAMKAVDPSVKIGAVLTTPGNWPDAVVAEGDSASWNQTVLTIAGPSIDFVVLHWYPGGTDTADALNKPAQATDIGELTRAQLHKYAGPDSARIGIALTELNAGAGLNTQPGALFAADAYPSLWAAGVFNVDWWNVHNGIDKVTTVAGQTDYNDFGLLSSGSCLADGTTCEPGLNTPFAPYHALDLLDTFANPADQLIRVTTGDPLVVGHAVRRKNGELAVLLLNEHPDAAKQVSLTYPGYVPAPGKPTVSTYLNGGSGITVARTGTPKSQTLPAYSLTVVRLRPLLPLVLPPAPGTPTVDDITDTGATATWPAARRGLLPAAGYEVYLQDAGGSRLAGRTRGTSLALTGLDVGTRYTVTVLAKDVAGVASWSSAPTAFVTGTPASSTCAVHLTNASDWGNGYVGSVDITNTGTEPVDGWTLAFTFPRSWESFGGGWNATWTAEGADVSTTNVDWNAAIAPGATINIGYVGNYAGPNVLPNLFTLNGDVCTTR
jgi:hypothetical protein